MKKSLIIIGLATMIAYAGETYKSNPRLGLSPENEAAAREYASGKDDKSPSVLSFDYQKIQDAYMQNTNSFNVMSLQEIIQSSMNH